MKKVQNPNSISRNFILTLAFLLSFSLISTAQTPAPAAVTPATTAMAAAPTTGGDAAKGKEIFNANCAACHKLDAKMTGPALRGISPRLSNEWLYKWIKNSSAMIKSGDAEAVRISKEYNGVVMTAFPQLTNGDIDNIIAYTSEKKEVAPAAVIIETKGASSDSGVTNNIVLGALVFVMMILIVMLFLIRNLLNKVADTKGVDTQKLAAEKTTPIWVAFARNQFLVLVSALLLILTGAYFVYGFFMQLDVNQDYSPVQPIHYSHRIHAGSNGINCQYCHSAARVSKNAGIPSLNICMNCHKNIAEVSDTTATAEYSKKFYDGEIQKLYKAVGWDGSKYTGKTEPVKWVRIHNLQDFVYFNHSQHVTVAGVECQTCHGPVQTYEVQKQFAKLTMGWCIDCHRKTEVKMEGNEYYTKIHEELAKKYGKDKLTAAEMGGLECGKCHY
jgi:mono/diheme cytochrome c family protein